MTKRAQLLSAAALGLVLVGGFMIFSGGDTPVGPVSTKATASTETAAATGAAPAPATADSSNPSITVARAGRAVLKDSVRASGLVGAVESVQVQPQIEGQAIDAVMAEVGDHVDAGAPLARLSDTALKLAKSQFLASQAAAKAQIAQAEAQQIVATSARDEARRQWDRAKQLHDKGNASQAAADQAQTAATSAEAQLSVAIQGLEAARAQLGLVEAQLEDVELKLKRTLVTTPVAGKVVTRNADVGTIASGAGQPMFVIIRDGLLELSADVAEQDIPRLSNGMRATLRAAGSDKALTGTIRLIEPSIDLTTRLGRVRITVDQSDAIRTGMFLEAAIEVSVREVIAVPITALGTDDEGAFVMTVDAAGKVHRNGVVTGVRDGKLIEIAEGVEEGAQVVAKAASFVRDGDMVNPVAAETAEAGAAPAATN